MMNLSEVGALLAALPTGQGLFYAGATGPYFLRPDGSILDKDGIMVAKPSAIGAAAYADHAGYLGQSNPLLGAIEHVDEISSTIPIPYAAGDLWIKENTGADVLYIVSGGNWVESGATLTEAASEPAEPTEGDYWLDTDDETLYKYVTDAFVEVVDVDYIRQATAPTLYPVGYKIVDPTDATISVLNEEMSWESGDPITAKKLYTDGTSFVSVVPAATSGLVGGVTMGFAIPDSEAATVEALVTNFNSLLAILRTSGVLATPAE